ncbi:MAG: restriction endonuclease subunit R [Microcystaceae cyanobacterium]
MDFFSEWYGDIPGLTSEEQARCDRIKNSFIYLLRYPPLLENTVKMVVISPLLDMAGFYLPPFQIQSETSIQITGQDDNVIIKGSLDILVLSQSLWLLIIESKRVSFSLEVGRSQLLAYMLASPIVKSKPIYGLLTNGSNFQFLKLAYKNQVPVYQSSDEFVIYNRENGLYQVIKILKRLAQEIIL